MMKRAVVAALVAVYVPAGGAVAHADPADDQFVAALNAANVPGNRTAEIAIARESCGIATEPRIGWGPIQPPAATLMIKIRNELLDQGVEPGTQMRAFERATAAAYCPDLNSVFTN